MVIVGVDSDMATVLPEERKAGITAVPLGRCAAADEVTDVAVCLAGLDVGYVTGAGIPVDGDLVSRRINCYATRYAWPVGVYGVARNILWVGLEGIGVRRKGCAGVGVVEPGQGRYT
jgi:glyoxylate carboligase